MDNMRDQYAAEIRRLEDAIRRTSSERLRTDYGKAVRRMRKELKDYDRYRAGSAGPGV